MSVIVLALGVVVGIVGAGVVSLSGLVGALARALALVGRLALALAILDQLHVAWRRRGRNPSPWPCATGCAGSRR